MTALRDDTLVRPSILRTLGKTRTFGQGWFDWTKKIIAIGQEEAKTRTCVKTLLNDLSEEDPSEGTVGCMYICQHA